MEKVTEESEEKMTNLSHLLKSIRKGLKISQSDLAKRLGCTQGYVSKIERGEADMSAGMLIEFMVWLMEEVKDE